MLADSELMAFISTTDMDRANAFYGGLLGLTPILEDGFASVFRAGVTTLRVTKVEAVAPPAYTVLGWMVTDIAAKAREMAAAGVSFARYDFLDQDDAGIWTAPNGDRVAWFTDPDGHNLSISQHM